MRALPRAPSCRPPTERGRPPLQWAPHHSVAHTHRNRHRKGCAHYDRMDGPPAREPHPPPRPCAGQTPLRRSSTSPSWLVSRLARRGVRGVPHEAWPPELARPPRPTARLGLRCAPTSEAAAPRCAPASAAKTCPRSLDRRPCGNARTSLHSGPLSRHAAMPSDTRTLPDRRLVARVPEHTPFWPQPRERCENPVSSCERLHITVSRWPPPLLVP